MAVQVDTIEVAFELEELRFKIESVRAELLDGNDQDDDTPTPTAAHHDINKQEPTLSESGKTSRFSQIRSRFRFGRKSSVNAESISVETASVDSQLTLVDSLPYHPPVAKNDTHYLTLLAPLVACLQRLSPSILVSADHNLRVTFLARCEDLSDLLKELKKEALFSPFSHAEEENDDMRLLLFTALHEKVLLEKAKCASPQPFRSSSPLSPVKEIENPFILHSSSLTATRAVAPRTPSPPKPIAPLVKVEAGGFSDFMGHSQQTWRMTVHRLGSFQASALFSPSPIAVNKAMRVGAARL